MTAARDNSSDATRLAALATELEAATEPHVMLDWKIASMMGFDLVSRPEDGAGFVIKSATGYDRCPRYTSSLDAALSIVPDDGNHIWKIYSDFPGDSFWAIVTDFDDGEFTEHDSGCCPSAALAVCIAALKARAVASATRERRSEAEATQSHD